MRRRAKGIKGPGLAIVRRPRRCTGWCVIHESSDLTVAHSFKSKWQAEEFCEQVAEFTDWTKSLTEVTDSPTARRDAIAAAEQTGGKVE